MTIKEISKALNISISTVSKALNGATDISEETKKRVLKYAESVGYKQKTTAKPSRRICAMYERVDSDTRNDILNLVVNSFTDVAAENNFEVISDTISGKPEGFVLDEYLRQNNFCAAFILGMTFKSPIYRQLSKTSVPLVLLDNRVPNCPIISSVTSDNTAAIASAVRYLTGLGHEKIGILLGEKGSLVCSERLAGYIIGLAQAGLDLKAEYVYYGDFTKQSGEEAASFFMQTDVTAVISCSDYMAMGLIDGLQKSGRRVPEDVSVMGFDDLRLLKYTSYNLTTIKQDFDKMGEQAFYQISDMLNGRQSQHVMLSCSLVERGSVLAKN